MFKYRDTKNEAVRLMMFPLSLTEEAKTLLDELNEGTIETWDELRTAFISRFFPPSLFDRLLREIRAFSQQENESLTNDLLHMKEMLRNCHDHNMSKGNIIKIFYDCLSEITQEVLNAAAGDYAMKHSYSNDDTCFSIDVIDEILEEYFNALLNEGRKILHYIEGTLLEEEIFTEFNEFMAMNVDENSDSESDTEEQPFEKITINANYKIKTSLEEPPTDFKLKPLPNNLEYVFLEEPSFLPVIISSHISKEKKNKLVSVLKKHKQAFSWKTTDIPGICPLFCKHKIQLLDDKKPVVQKQRRLNLNMQEVFKKEVVKLLDTGIIYPIADSPWVSPIHCMPKKGGITVVTNENDELVPTRTVMGWRVCINYRKLNEATAKDHFLLPFMDQMRMPFGLCNAPATFQRCMLAIFHDMIKESVEEKCHFMVKKGIMLGHKVSSAGREVDKAKVDVISKLPPPTNIKDNPAIWSRKLDDALWAFRTAYKTPTGTTPYKLIYGKNCYLPFTIEHRAYWAFKNCNPDLIAAGEKQMFQLHELDELRHQAYEYSRL
uniref:Reverse transcriptase domain-containing protein n=1 Tax=Tanacetum cinerariifolium TaxID=118510 RepID=A0A6L2MD28_TANCI|nr:reverse transcriptase domain-containing protein [Tanacetum cinerariifolium]